MADGKTNAGTKSWHKSTISLSTTIKDGATKWGYVFTSPYNASCRLKVLSHTFGEEVPDYYLAGYVGVPVDVTVDWTITGQMSDDSECDVYLIERSYTPKYPYGTLNMPSPWGQDNAIMHPPYDLTYTSSLHWDGVNYIFGCFVVKAEAELVIPSRENFTLQADITIKAYY